MTTPAPRRWFWRTENVKGNCDHHQYTTWYDTIHRSSSTHIKFIIIGVKSLVCHIWEMPFCILLTDFSCFALFPWTTFTRLSVWSFRFITFTLSELGSNTLLREFVSSASTWRCCYGVASSQQPGTSWWKSIQSTKMGKKKNLSHPSRKWNWCRDSIWWLTDWVTSVESLWYTSVALMRSKKYRRLFVSSLTWVNGWIKEENDEQPMRTLITKQQATTWALKWAW